MYKAKYKIWILLLIISIVICNFSTVIATIKKNNPFSCTTYKTYVSVTEKNMAERLGTFKKSGAKIQLVTNINNADVIIKNSSDEVIEGYTKYAEQFTSPIVMFVPSKAYSEDNTGFVHQSYSTSMSTYKYIQKDLLSILEAVESDKKYTDLGIDKDIFGDKEVKLAIPDKNAEGYDDVILLIKLTLNNYSYDNLDNTNLTTRVNKILDKCIKYEDVSEYFDSIRNNKKTDKTIILAPEYMFSRNTYLDYTGDSSYYIECLPTKTIEMKYDLFLKNKEDNKYYDNLLKAFTKGKFFDNLGLRNKEIDFKINDKTHAPEIISTIEK